MSAAVGASVPFAEYMPGGLIPAALAQSDEAFRIPGKDPGLIVLNDRPVNAETPPWLLDDAVTPAERLFVRNNGIPPGNIDSDAWTLSIEGEAARSSVSYTLKELQERFQHYSYQMTIECGGNGRAEFVPPAKGNQWRLGAVGCPRWTGVRLRDVLESAGITEDAVYIGYYGDDSHISGDPKKVPISRGVPIEKALQKESLLAWAINGADLPVMNGYPLRLVIGGWPASNCGKWLKKIVIRNKIHDGAKMGGYSYRVPCHPVAPGAEVAETDMCIIESMPVKSLITYPRSGAIIEAGRTLTVRGHAWAGDRSVAAMAVSIDFGATWQKCALKHAVNRFAWQQWSRELHFPGRGYYEVWARATDSMGRLQPMVVPGWNPKGYLNNACHRIAVKVV